MKLIEMWIEGDMPLLLCRPSEEALSNKTRKNTAQADPNPRDIAEKTVYRTADQQLCFPGAAFMRLAREAASNHKVRGSRKSLKFLVPSAVFILDEYCGLYLHDRSSPSTTFEVDSRSVVIPSTKGRIMCHRARLNEWSCRVHMKINEELIAEALVRQLFNEGGQRIGVGAFRPEKGGPFGIYAITRWDTISDQPKRSEAKHSAALPSIALHSGAQPSDAQRSEAQHRETPEAIPGSLLS